MYEEILVPTDGSVPSLQALDEAADLAAQQGARLHVLYVIDVTMLGDVSDVAVVESIEQAGENAINRAADRARDAGVETVIKSVRRGTPHRTVLEYVDDNDIDLVVMGTHGRTGLNRLLLGSVTEKVIRLSPVPVLTVRPGSEDGDEADQQAGEAQDTG
jgi:nucleotide-binding universal stress UspA family protein